MKVLKKDKAGNKIIKYRSGKLGVMNSKGKLVNKKDSSYFLKKHGYKTKMKKGKLHVIDESHSVPKWDF